MRGQPAQHKRGCHLPPIATWTSWSLSLCLSVCLSFVGPSWFSAHFRTVSHLCVSWLSFPIIPWLSLSRPCLLSPSCLSEICFLFSLHLLLLSLCFSFYVSSLFLKALSSPLLSLSFISFPVSPLFALIFFYQFLSSRRFSPSPDFPSLSALLLLTCCH